MARYLAVDIGASSGKMLLGQVENGRISLEEVHRFDNLQQTRDGHLCWDVDHLFQSILQGLKNCKKLGRVPDTVGIDTWAVDFVLLDKQKRLLGQSVAYRDSRTEGMDAVVDQRISAEMLYAKTGIQKQPFNTIYQLAALQKEHPGQLEQAEWLLMVPEYLNFLLTGECINEYTNATSTGMVNAESKTWDADILRAMGLPSKLFRTLYKPGTPVGRFSSAVREEIGFDCTVVLPATHDTGSAFLAVPSESDAAVTISSGTWSLLGVENPRPITTEQSRRLNFTNEGGYDYRYRYLKNIMGLWMIQSIRRNLDKKYSFAALEDMAKACPDFPSRVDVNDGAFLAPDSMIDAVKEACRRTGQPVPSSIGELMRCVYQSLAGGYAAAIRELESVTRRSFDCVHIVGGGSKDGYLNALTARATGLPVHAGPVEGTALGNLMAQMIAAGEFAGLSEARAAVRASFPIVTAQP